MKTNQSTNTTGHCKQIALASLVAAICGIASYQAAAQSIAVPTFGTGLVGFQTKQADQTFPTGTPPNWTVTSSLSASPNFSSTDVNNGAVNWVGTSGAGSWQSPDGNNTVNLDGSSVGESGLPGQIFTTIAVPHAGTVSISFWLAGDPINDNGQDTVIKKVGVQLGTTLAAAASSTAVVNSFDTTGKTISNMGWEIVTDTFNVGGPGNYVLLFISLDTNVVNGAPAFSPGPDAGPAIGTVTATEGVPDNGSTLVLLGMSAIGMALVGRRMVKSAC